MNRTVFVTGGAGYVGAHCCKAFAQAGWRVIVYDNLFRGHREFVRWGELIEGDILDFKGMTEAMARTRPDAVAHFAALTYVGESVEDPGRYYLNNTLGGLNVLEAMRKSGVSKIVFSSTAATFGTPLYTPMEEDHPQNPINPYGQSKLFMERMLADFSAAYGVRYAALRYFNAAGADLDGEIGEHHEPETHVIPLAIRGIQQPDYTFTIFGDDFDTRDGSALRDYIHVSDLGDAHVKALDYLMAGGASEAFNLGAGIGTTVKEIAAAVEKVAGKPLPKVVGPRRAGDPPSLVASPAKAERILGWRAKHSDIETIVRSAWAWHAKHG
jgi:UDP-arabinose 4-epimerase